MALERICPEAVQPRVHYNEVHLLSIGMARRVRVGLRLRPRGEAPNPIKSNLLIPD